MLRRVSWCEVLTYSLRRDLKLSIISAFISSMNWMMAY